MKSILLDTNAYTRFCAGDQDVCTLLGAAETVLFSVVVLGEVLAGFRLGTRQKENRRALDEFLAKPSVRMAHITSETSEVYAEVFAQLRTAGTPIPLNDIWIASQVLETGATLVTYDAHFQRVPGLRTWNGA
jgi:tRNA(fMet)-specific endonuclease VapC